MKTFLTLLVLALGLVAAFSADVKLAWDANPAAEQVSAYRIHEQVGANWTPLAFTTGSATNATLTNVAPGIHTYALTAVNLWGESPRSSSVSTPGITTAPKNITITISVSVP